MSPPSSLTASYPTDYWRKPPSTNVHNAPTFLRQVDSLNFHRARVTVSADWVRLYDQGGLFVEFPPRDDQHHHSQGEGQGEYKRFWLKTGIEFYNDIPNLSTVSAQAWADWSLLPLPASETKITIQLEREEINATKGTGSSLWVYKVDKSPDGKEIKTALREVTWAFEREGPINVGVYAARPTSGNGGNELIVNFEDFLLE